MNNQQLTINNHPMTKAQQYTILFLRIALGVIFIYSGLSKILNPAFSSAGFLGSAQSLQGFYAWFASPEVLPITNILNSWGQLAIGLSLISGLLVRYSSLAGILLMILYYFPGLHFPYVGKTAFLIDDHVVYALVFVALITFNAGGLIGLDGLLGKKVANNKINR